MSSRKMTSPPPEIADIPRCPECRGTKLVGDYDSAEVICMDCGYVLDTKLADRGPEWRAFNKEQ